MRITIEQIKALWKILGEFKDLSTGFELTHHYLEEKEDRKIQIVYYSRQGELSINIHPNGSIKFEHGCYFAVYSSVDQFIKDDLTKKLKGEV